MDDGKPQDLVEAVALHAQLLQRWRRSQATRDVYDVYLSRYLRFLDERGISPRLEALTPHLVGQCRDWFRDRRRPGAQDGAASDAALVTFLKAFARAMVEEGVYEHDPLERLKTVRRPQPHRAPYTPAEIEQLLRAIDYGPNPARNRAIFLVLLDTGCRIGELCNASIGDVDLEQGSIVFRRTKNGHPRRVLFRVEGLADGGPCAAAVAAWIHSRHARPTDPLFIMADGQRLTPQHARTCIIEPAARMAGVAGAIPHRFRHTAATAFLEVRPGAELQLQARLGQLSPAILADYVHFTQAMDQRGAEAASLSTRWLGADPPPLPAPARRPAEAPASMRVSELLTGLSTDERRALLKALLNTEGAVA